MDHRSLRDDEFWKAIPAWEKVTREEFGQWRWQQKNTLTKVDQISNVLGPRLEKSLLADLMDGLKKTPMNIRITPYVFSLIDWDNPIADPLRKQFLPLGSQFLPDHPMALADSLHEDVDSPVPLLTHRYPDKVLFLPITICPVYCSYCTRSRVIGGSTESVEKETYGANQKKWEAVFEYLKAHESVEDVVISGGDAYMLGAKQVTFIGESLLNIPHIRRLRFATKGPAIFPMKITTDDAWFGAINHVHKLGRKLGKQVAVHTHFSSPQEITWWSAQACDRLFQEGITLRNQAVLQEGVNDTPEEMIFFTRQLSYLNVRPYYVYVHDMVPGCEHFRTTVGEAMELEKAVRGTTAGFNTPNFVLDLPKGGGKRQVASFEYYDRENGISLWTAPFVRPGKTFFYFDPLHKLSAEAQKRWGDPQSRQQMVEEALKHR